MNKEFGENKKFILTCLDDTLSKDQSDQLVNTFNNIPFFSDNYLKLYARAIIKCKLQNYNGSVDDYKTILNFKPDYSLAYFNRANTRYEMITFMNALKDYNNNVIYIGSYKTQNTQKISTQNYDEVVADYRKCIQLNPWFFYTYFNLANVEIDSKDFTSAITNYSRALEIEPKFAEAYYNRGLTYIYIQQKEEGCTDLSKAGELGVQKAYTVIKKFCNN